MRLKLLLLFTVAVTPIFASDAETDVIQRTVNFVIFAALAYYLMAGFVKKFFADRSNAIAASFERAQDRAKEAKLAYEQAAKELDDAKLKKDEIIATAKDEAVLLSNKIAEKNKEDIAVLHKLKEETKIVAENKMLREVVNSTMSDVLASDELFADQAAIVQNITKRVA